MSVYFIKCADKVKIGVSKKPYKRLASLQSGNPFPMDMIAIMPGSSATEHELHSVFHEYHHRNEWYDFEGELKEFAEMIARIFSEYHEQFERDGEYADERDWEMWKSRAIAAESALASHQFANGGTFDDGFTDW